MRSFIAVIVITVLFYIGGTVASADTDPFHWEKSFREPFACVWLLICLLGAFALTKGGPFDQMNSPNT